MPSSAATSIAPASSRTKCSGDDPAGASGRNRSTARYWYRVVIRAVAARVVPNASWVTWPVVRTRCSQIMRSSHRSRAVSRAASAAASCGLRASRPAARGRPGRADGEGIWCPPLGWCGQVWWRSRGSAPVAGGAGGPAVGGAGRLADEPCPARDWGRERAGAQGEGGSLGAIGDEPGGGLVGVEVGQVVGGQHGGGVVFEVPGVFGADGEDDLGAGVGADALAQVRGELGEVLVRHGDGEPVGAGFG